MSRRVLLQLSALDGNAFSLLAAFHLQALLEGWTPEEIKAVRDECQRGDYEHLLATLADHCTDPTNDESNCFGDPDDNPEGKAASDQSAAQATKRLPPRAGLPHRITLRLEGSGDFVAAAFQKRAKKEGWPPAAIKAVLTEARSGDYNHLLNTLHNHCIDPDVPEGVNDIDGY
jgi:hypothetical protein